MKYKKPVYHLNLSANDRCENINRIKNKIMEDRFKEQINFVSTSSFADAKDENFNNIKFLLKEMLDFDTLNRLDMN